MSIRTLEYQLVDGYIHNWLVAGPQVQTAESSLDSAEPHRQPELHLDEPPVDRGKFAEGMNWRYFRCREDHQIIVPVSAPIRQYVRVWACTHLAVKTAGEVSLLLRTSAPVDLWLNGTMVYQSTPDESPERTQLVRIQARLELKNEIVLCLRQPVVRGLSLSAALCLAGIRSDAVTVQVPTQARFPNRFQQLEDLLDHAYLEEAASYRGKVVNLRFGEGAEDGFSYAYSIQDSKAMIYVEGTWDVKTEQGLDVGHPERIFERPGQVVLRAPGKEYFEQELRYQRSMPLYILDNSFSSEPYGTYGSRRAEALKDAARRDGLLFAEAAKMLLDQWDKLDLKAIGAAIRQVAAHEAGSELTLVGLLGIVARFGSHASFPKDAFEGLEQAVLGYAFNPGDPQSGVDYGRESSQILIAAAEVLAGQLYPEAVFAASGKSGKQHCEAGEAKAFDWLRQRAETGFAEWDSPEGVEHNVVALSHLVSLAQNEALLDFSAVLLDKILFLMAVNSFKGVYGGSMGHASAAFESAALKSGRVQASAGIARLLWGTGIYSAQLAGAISLAISDYEFPSFFADIAANPQSEIWSRERHEVPGGEVNKVVFKTPGALLGSAQDYRPGQSGASEHIWQATVGSDALVFVNHPASFGQNESSQPGFWLGNGSLPRVAQWKDALVAVYRIPEDSAIDFTHAYFPIFMFDEYVIDGGWAIARKDQGYIAIAAANGLELMKQAPDGYRELRSPGRNNVWLCQVGRVDTDGDFIQFKRKVLAQKVDWREWGARFTSTHGSELSFGWEGPFIVDGQEVKLDAFPHIEDPYCKADYPAKQMNIHNGEYELRLDFE